MILGREEIEKYIKEDKIIEDYNSEISKNNPAKIELRLGEKCYISSNTHRIVDLSEGKKVIIKPNDIFLYQTLEKVNLPNFIAGHVSLKMKHTALGLLMSSQTQVDPGYNNYLFGMMYNLSNRDIVFNYGDPIITLEMFKFKNTSKNVYHGKMEKISFEEFCRNRAASSLGKLSTDLKGTIKAVKRSERYLTVLMAIVAVVTLGMGVIAFIFSMKPSEETVRLSEKLEYQQQIINEMNEKITDFEKIFENNSSSDTQK